MHQNEIWYSIGMVNQEGFPVYGYLILQRY